MTRLRIEVALCALGALLLVLFAFTGAKAQQQPTPAEIIDALNMKVAGLESTLNQAYVTIAQQKAVLADARSKAKVTADYWKAYVFNPTRSRPEVK